jgi:GNAT superfamily N-acetyltransferase
VLHTQKILYSKKNQSGETNSNMRNRPNTKINIRYATAIDNVLLSELGTRTFYDAFAADNTPENMKVYLAKSFSPEIQAAELAYSSSLFLIAEDKKIAVGYARLKQEHAPACVRGNRPIEIVRMYVRQEWIGGGVGKRLMEACLNEARKRECDTIWLSVWEHNSLAQAFYHKWGFVEVGQQIFQVGDDPQNDILMQRAVKAKDHSDHLT